MMNLSITILTFLLTKERRLEETLKKSAQSDLITSGTSHVATKHPDT